MERLKIYKNDKTHKEFVAVWRSALDGKVWARIAITNTRNGDCYDYGKFATKKQANEFIEKNFMGEKQNGKHNKTKHKTNEN